MLSPWVCGEVVRVGYFASFSAIAACSLASSIYDAITELSVGAHDAQNCLYLVLQLHTPRFWGELDAGASALGDGRGRQPLVV